MLKRANQIQTLDIASLHTSNVIDQTDEMIIDPNNLSVVGFYLSESPEKILLARDIRECNDKQAIIDSSDVFAEPDDLLRLKDTLDIKYRLVGAKAWTKSGKKLGTVTDYVIDDVSWMIQKLHVKQPLFSNLSNGTLIIDRRQVIEVTDDQVIVEDAILGNRKFATQNVS